MNNSAFVDDSNEHTNKTNANNVTESQLSSTLPSPNELEMENGARISSTIRDAVEPKERENWGRGIEFLMSCVAMSVGLGNVWRFPFTALDNGGGAFLLPYLIVLFIVGRPIYYLEMIVGQFSSRNNVKMYQIAPAFRGTGIGQIVAISLLSTFYSSIMALIGRYLFDSFKSPLPWVECQDNWINCMNSNGDITNPNASMKLTSSSEYYFM